MTTGDLFRAAPVGDRSAPLPSAALEQGPFSPQFHAASELVGRRWTGAVLFALHHGLARFTDIKRAVPGLSARLLTERLRQLEAAGVIEREVLADPEVIRYQLTAKGDELRPVLIALNGWANRWSDG